MDRLIPVKSADFQSITSCNRGKTPGAQAPHWHENATPDSGGFHAACTSSALLQNDDGCFRQKRCGVSGDSGCHDAPAFGVARFTTESDLAPLIIAIGNAPSIKRDGR